MADLYGATTIPLSASIGTPIAITPTTGDPFLSYLASYLKCVVNARCGAAWLAVHPANGNPISNVFELDPEVDSFNAKHLPALFLWRSGGRAYEQIASDFRVSRETIGMRWIMPGASFDIIARRVQFANMLVKCIDDAINVGRDKSWRVTGDTETQAAYAGSLLWTYAKCWQFNLQTWERRPLVIKSINGDTSSHYHTWTGSLEIRERDTSDLARYQVLDQVDVVQRTETGGFVTGKVMETYTLED